MHDIDNIRPDIELKRCPFCGARPKVIDYKDVEYKTVRCSNMMCIACDIDPSYDTVEEASEAWNRRAT